MDYPFLYASFFDANPEHTASTYGIYKLAKIDLEKTEYVWSYFAEGAPLIADDSLDWWGEAYRNYHVPRLHLSPSKEYLLFIFYAKDYGKTIRLVNAKTGEILVNSFRFE